MPVTSPPRLDGVLDDAAWQSASPASGFIQTEPYEGQVATEQTEVRILYDRDNLYIGVFCQDAVPGGVLVKALKEDFEPNDGDYFQVILDTYRDRRNGFLFTVNPHGARRDAQVSDEGRSVNADWDTVWDVRTQIGSSGWTAEIAIPFKSLSFDQRRTGQVWGVNFARKIRRKNEVGFWAPVARRYDISRLSLAGELRGLESITRGRNLRVKPFLIADTENLAQRSTTTFDSDVGLDVKYSLTPSLTVDLTVNTDFSQVEVDEQVVNLTRFAVVFPEKREFFLENSGIFHFGDIPGEKGSDRSKETQLFFSRRIGLFPDGHSRQGEPTGILGGARLSGRVGRYNVGVLSLQTKEADDNPRTAAVEALPSNNFTIVRVKRDMFGTSDIGAVLVNRQASAGADNRAWGVDGNFRIGQYLAINGYLAQTKTDGLACGDACRDRAEKISGNWRDNIFRVQVVYSNIQEHFNPEVGLKGVPGGRDSAESLRTNIEMHMRPRKNSWIREVNPHHKFFYMLDPDRRTVYKEGHYTPIEVFFHNGARAEISYNPRFDRVDRPFTVPSSPDLTLPVGDYQYGHWQLELESDASKPVFATADIQAGSYYTGRVRTLNLSGTFRPGYRWSAQGTLVNSRVRLLGREYTNRVVRSRISWSINTRMFLNALIQYNSVRKQVSSNVRFDFLHRPLSNLYLVLNEARDVSGASRDDRAFTVKYTHMLSF
jgi:hypothetical protein